MSKKRKKDFKLKYIIHYESFDFYINVTEISKKDEPRIRAAKLVQEQIGGANF